MKKLAGRTDLEDAVKRLDNLTQEEARMALAEVLRVTQNIRDEVKIVIEGARGVFSHSPIPSDIHTFSRKGGKSDGEGSEIRHPTDRKQRR